MTAPKHPTGVIPGVIYTADVGAARAAIRELRQWEAARVDTVRGPAAIVIDDGVSLTGGPNSPASVLIPDTVGGEVGPGVIPLPLPSHLGPGRLVRDDAARGWRFEPEAGR